MIETISDDPEVQALYEEIRATGATHKLAEMLALRKAPGLVTDTTFMTGAEHEWDGDRDTGRAYADIAKAQGVDVNGAKYCAQLAQYPGDPRAWIRNKADVKRVCEEQNLVCDGAVKVKPKGLPPAPPGPAIAPDIVKDGVDDMIAMDRTLKEVPRDELERDFVERHKPHWKED